MTEDQNGTSGEQDASDADKKLAADMAIINLSGVVAGMVDRTQDKRLKEVEKKLLSFVDASVLRTMLIDKAQASQQLDPREQQRQDVQNRWQQMFQASAEKRQHSSAPQADLVELIKQIKEVLDDDGRAGSGAEDTPKSTGEQPVEPS